MSLAQAKILASSFISNSHKTVFSQIRLAQIEVTSPFKADIATTTPKDRFGGKFSQHGPLFVALLVLWILVLVVTSLRQDEQGLHPAYPIDDAYIHMAIAKNLVRHGVWGVTPYEFSSSASSILWPLVLAFSYLLTGVNQFAPLVLNLLFASLSLVAVYKILRSYQVATSIILLTLLAIVFMAPLPTLVVDGMEHNLQILVVLLFTWLSVRLLSQPQLSLKSWVGLSWLALAALVTAARYEGLFLIFVVGLLLLWRKRWLAALAMGLMAALPLVIYGLVSINNGSFWLPNSVLLKGHSPDAINLATFLNLFGLYVNNDYQVPIYVAPHIFVLALAALGVYLLRYGKQAAFWKEGQLLLIIFLVVTYLHLQLAALHWFYRYEDYLVVLGLTVVVAVFFENSAVQPVVKVKVSANQIVTTLIKACLIFLLLLPLTDRGMRALQATRQASTDIYTQQYQMALFVKEFYAGSGVALNDIGAVNYLSDIRCLDVIGLGDAQVLALRKAKTYGKKEIAELAKAKGIKIAIVYNPPLDLGNVIPDNWVGVGQWSVNNYVVLGSPIVWFYAVEPTQAAQLQANFKKFEAKLPPNVHSTLLPIPLQPPGVVFRAG